MTVMADEFYTVEEVARKLRVSPDTIHRLLKQRKLAGYKVSGVWRIAPEDLQAYLASRRNAAQPE